MTETVSYHGQPVLKEPTWTWEIPNYLFTGGLGGASAGFAYVCELRGDHVLARRAWATSLAGLVVSPALLISDLGRPLRFLNMLRVFKVTSPMSVGSWILVAASGAVTPATAAAWLELPAPLALAGRLAAPAAAVLGMPLSTYTGALLSTTSIPVWHEARRTLPFVFAAGAALSAGGVAVVLNPPTIAAPARRLALGSAVAEMAVTELMERRLGRHQEPYTRGSPRVLRHVARGCLIAGTAVLATAGRRSRPAAVAAGSLLLAGALSTRWGVFKAGFQAAADPAFVVGPQRDRITAGADHGARRSETSASPDPELGTPALQSRSPLRGMP